MSSVRRRLIANAGATTVAKGLSVIIQIVSVPVLLAHWGTSVYGEWILLSTVPSYFAMSDIGFGNVAANEMTMLVAMGKRNEAIEVFQSVSLFMTCVSLLMGVILTLGIWTLPIDQWLRIRNISVHDARFILLLLGLSALLSLQEGLFGGCFRCVGKSAIGSAAKSVVQAGSFVGLLTSVALNASPFRVSAVIVIINAVGTICLWVLLKSQVEWLRYGRAFAQRSTIRRLFLPAISFMSFPVSNILNIQGILMVVGYAFGPLGVVTFSTARTISRSVLQGMQLINTSVWPEISIAFGAGNLELVRKLHRTSCQISIILCTTVTVIAAVFGNKIWHAWTIGKVETDSGLLTILLFQMLVGSLWYTSSVVPAAINKHSGIARTILVTSGFQLLLAFLLMKITFLGLRGAAVAFVIGDSIIALFVLRSSLGLIGDDFQNFIRSMFKLPRILPARR